MSETRHKPPGSRSSRATQRVVGRAGPGEAINAKWRVHYERLLELHEALMRQRRGQFEDAAAEQPSFSMHMADAGTDSYDRDLALGMLSHEQDAVYEIEQAIARIRNGTYGVCELTGKKIPAERLTAIPWTRFTAEAERQLEKDGEAERAQLGPRQSVRETEQGPRERK